MDIHTFLLSSRWKNMFPCLLCFASSYRGLIPNTSRALENNFIPRDEFVIRLLASSPLVRNTLTTRLLICSFFLIRSFFLICSFFLILLFFLIRSFFLFRSFFLIRLFFLIRSFFLICSFFLIRSFFLI